MPQYQARAYYNDLETFDVIGNDCDLQDLKKMVWDTIQGSKKTGGWVTISSDRLVNFKNVSCVIFKEVK